MRYEKEHGGGGVGGNVKYPWVCAQEGKRIYFIFYLCKGRWELGEVVWTEGTHSVQQQDLATGQSLDPCSQSIPRAQQ